MPEDQIMLSINMLTTALEGNHTNKFDAQMQAITALQDMYIARKHKAVRMDEGISNPPPDSIITTPPKRLEPEAPSPRVQTLPNPLHQFQGCHCLHRPLHHRLGCVCQSNRKMLLLHDAPGHSSRLSRWNHHNPLQHELGHD